MIKIPNRIVMTTKDIQLITGCSDRTARRMLARIRVKKGKGKRGLVSVEEFCEDTGLSEEEVKVFLV